MERRVWSPLLQPYEEILKQMQQRALDIAAGRVEEAVWLLQHEAVYTAGPRTEDFPQDISVLKTPRGGFITYHGPGQYMVYCLLSLRQRGLSAFAFIQTLEIWLIEALSLLGVTAFLNPPHTGVWTSKGKIAAIGIHVSQGVTTHGAALNINPDLKAFQKIIPCNLDDTRVTSVHAEGFFITKEDAESALWATCPF